LILTDERSGLLTRTATTESGSFASEKLSAFVELEAMIRACGEFS
jgi:hypothetical protein